MNVLKGYYREVRAILTDEVPSAWFVFHDAFSYNADLWNDVFADDDIKNVAIDHH